MKRFYTMVRGYLGGWAIYGFCRGWNADYDYNKYNEEYPIRPIKYHLLTEKYCLKSFRGIVNGFMYGSFGHVFALYRFLGRAEVALFNYDPYQNMDLYLEWLDNTTLPPRS